MWDIGLKQPQTTSSNAGSYLSILADVIKEFTTRNILHHHEDICRGANNLIPTEMKKAEQ